MIKIVLCCIILFFGLHHSTAPATFGWFKPREEATSGARCKLVNAINKNDIATIKSLFNNYNFNLNEINVECACMQFLHWSIFCNAEQCVKFFLNETTANINIQDCIGQYPIDKAVNKVNTQIFDLLVAHKNINLVAIDKDKSSLLERIILTSPRLWPNQVALKHFVQTLAKKEVHTCRKSLIENYLIREVGQICQNCNEADFITSQFKLHVDLMVNFFKTKKSFSIPLINVSYHEPFNLKWAKKEFANIASQFECPCKECNSLTISSTKL